MCYSARYLLEKALKRAVHYGVKDDVDKYREDLEDYDEQFAVSGFAHPKIIVYKDIEPYRPVIARWGLIPSWVRSMDEALKIWNNTINARGESIFEKPAFRESARHMRCLIPMDGFYEHHHYKGKTYPFYIYRTDNEPLMVGGLWSEWVDKASCGIMTTCTIVTTKGNDLMAKIHNNPKLAEPRMPVILKDELQEAWLDPSLKTKDVLQKLIKPFDAAGLKAHTVRRLSGKESLGNVPEANEYFEYEGLEAL